MLPLILFFYAMSICSGLEFFNNWGKLIALALFILAAFTDWLDGTIARKYNMVTNTGKLLDPVADKMLVMLGFILILADPTWTQTFGEFDNFIFPYWFATLAVFVMLGRDVIMNSLRFIAATTIQFKIFAFTSVFILSVATILSIWSCINYITNYAHSVRAKEKENQNVDSTN